MLMLKTLDLLGAALCSHRHQWTDEERQHYEVTAAKLQEFTGVQSTDWWMRGGK